MCVCVYMYVYMYVYIHGVHQLTALFPCRRPSKPTEQLCTTLMMIAWTIRQALLATGVTHPTVQEVMPILLLLYSPHSTTRNGPHLLVAAVPQAIVVSRREVQVRILKWVVLGTWHRLGMMTEV